MFGICSGYVLDIFGIYVGYACDIFGICLGYVEDMLTMFSSEPGLAIWAYRASARAMPCDVDPTSSRAVKSGRISSSCQVVDVNGPHTKLFASHQRKKTSVADFRNGFEDRAFHGVRREGLLEPGEERVAYSVRQTIRDNTYVDGPSA